ncbi:hypothetical protein JOM56_010221 [Amanita muscaria]
MLSGFRLHTLVSNIPTEILSEIFYLLCKKPIFVSELNNSHCKENFPWGVGLVSRQWRTAFLSYPPIWASLALSESFGDSNTRSESYAIEINRRLALYLERSGGSPLTLDISLWSDHNKSFTMMAMEMLSACAHRWRSVRFDLFCEWQADCLLPCKGNLPTLERLAIMILVASKHALDVFEVAPRLTHAYIGPCGWMLPYAQLTELLLVLDVFWNGGVRNLLKMLHNVKKLCIHSDSEVLLLPSAPVPLNQLRVLEVPHPVVLSWFETPSLCDLSLHSVENNDEPLDVHDQISSLIQRSGCQIRKLSFRSNREVRVGALKDVEELEIHYRRSKDSSIDISSLPNLRFLTISVLHEEFEPLATSIVTALKSARVPPRNECSACTPISRLERVTVQLWSHEKLEIPKRLLDIAEKWPVVIFRTRRSAIPGSVVWEKDLT